MSDEKKIQEQKKEGEKNNRLEVSIDVKAGIEERRKKAQEIDFLDCGYSGA